MPLTAKTPLSTSGPTPGRTLIQEGGNREQKTQLANSLKNTGQGGSLSNAMLAMRRALSAGIGWGISQGGGGDCIEEEEIMDLRRRVASPCPPRPTFISPSPGQWARIAPPSRFRPLLAFPPNG